MIAMLVLPATLRGQLAKEAQAAFPRECCGLIEGEQQGDCANATALHAARNLALEPDRFEIDPAVQFRLVRLLRGTPRGIIGCYHSHPNGKAVPSARDGDGAGEENFIWLIVGLAARDAAVDIGACMFASGRFVPLRLA